MDNTIYLKHYDTIKNLIKTLGTDETDNYLVCELSNLTNQAATARKKIYTIKESISLQINRDEKIHLEYDLYESINFLNSMLEKLMTADEMYLCYKNYIVKDNS